jgi:long-chain acyl-CoA synthetase
MQMRINDLKYLLEHLDLKALIFWDKFKEKLFKIIEQSAVRYSLIQVGDHCESGMYSFFEIIERSETITIEDYPTESDEALILYSAGTTGHPKGAVFTHQALITAAKMMIDNFHITKCDKVICVLAVNHYLSQSFIIHAAFMMGASLYLFPYFAPEEIAKTICEHSANIFIGIQPMLNAFLKSPEIMPEQLSSLKYCLVTGSIIDEEIVKQFRNKFNIPVTQSYGCVEIGTIVSAGEFMPGVEPRTVGKPFETVSIKIIDEYGNELFPGEIGEITIQSPMNKKKYYVLSEDLPEQISTEWEYPHDIGMLDKQGNLVYIGHKEEIINKGHYAIYPYEIEQCLLKHEAVVEAAVVGIPDEVFIEEVKAYIILKPEVTLTQEEVIQYCRRFFPKYKCPRYVEFVETLPKNYSGSTIRRFLKKHTPVVVTEQSTESSQQLSS